MRENRTTTSSPTTTTMNRPKSKKRIKKQHDSTSDESEECDVEAWDTLSKSFKEAQTVLDQNRDLIHQVNSNHQSKIPDNIAKNVKLIREINGNISKVISIYSDLSVNFSGIVQERRRGTKSGDESGATDS